MANEWIRKDFDGATPATTLNGAIGGAATTIVLTSGTGYPDGTSGKFVVAIDRGTANEEKILVTSRSGVTLTVAQRGYDGTAAIAHSSGATVEHVLDAHTIDFSNALAAAFAAAGSMAFRGAGNTFTELPVGANDAVMVVVSGVPAWMAKADVMTLLLAGAAGNGLSVSSGVLAVTVDGTTIEIAADTVGIKAGGVGTTQLADAAVTYAKLAASVAGNGLTGGDASALAVNPDNISIEISAGQVRVKAGGITNAMLSTAAGEIGAAWKAWTPALTASSVNPTLGSGSAVDGEYLQIGKLVIARGSITFGSSGVAAGTGDYLFSLPVAAATSGIATALCAGSLRASALTGSAAAYLPGIIIDVASGNKAKVKYQAAWPSGTDTFVGAAAPAAPTTNTRYEYAIVYEAA